MPPYLPILVAVALTAAYVCFGVWRQLTKDKQEERLLLRSLDADLAILRARLASDEAQISRIRDQLYVIQDELANGQLARQFSSSIEEARATPPISSSLEISREKSAKSEKYVKTRFERV